MYCPDCKQILKCGCKTCVELKTHENDPGKGMIHVSDTQLEACPEYGVIRINEDWVEIEYKQYEENR